MIQGVVVRLEALTLLTALWVGAGFCAAQSPAGTANQGVPATVTVPPLPDAAAGPPLDLLKLSHAGAELEGHAEPAPPEPIDRPAEPVRATRFWGSAEYLLWWIRDSNVPVLLSTGAITDARPGALGMPG